MLRVWKVVSITRQYLHRQECFSMQVFPLLRYCGVSKRNSPFFYLPSVPPAPPSFLLRLTLSVPCSSFVRLSTLSPDATVITLRISIERATPQPYRGGIRGTAGVSVLTVVTPFWHANHYLSLPSTCLSTYLFIYLYLLTYISFTYCPFISFFTSSRVLN